jgi:phage regulator Rha-like protein
VALTRVPDCARTHPGVVDKAVLATRLRPEEGLVLRPGYVEGWRELRAELEQRREARRQQRRFRHDPAAYLAQLEQQCLQLTLPA